MSQVTWNQGSKVCAKFLAGKIFREKKLPGLSGGAGGRRDAGQLFFLAGPVAGWPGKIFFRVAGRPKGRARYFFRGWQPSWGFSYRESLIGRARPARGRPNFKPAGLEISRSAKKQSRRG